MFKYLFFEMLKIYCFDHMIYYFLELKLGYIRVPFLWKMA